MDTGKDTWIFKAAEKGNTTVTVICGTQWIYVEGPAEPFTLQIEII